MLSVLHMVITIAGHSVHSAIALSPISDHSNLRLKVSQSEIFSDIGLTFLEISYI
jgi:hypothetical protein